MFSNNKDKHTINSQQFRLNPNAREFKPAASPTDHDQKVIKQDQAIKKEEKLEPKASTESTRNRDLSNEVLISRETEVLFKRPESPTDYDHLFEKEDDFLIRLGSDDKYVISRRDSHGKIRHEKYNLKSCDIYFDKYDLAKLMEAASLGISRYKRQIYPNKPELKASPGLTVNDLFDPDKLRYTLGTYYNSGDRERLKPVNIPIPPEKMFDDSNQEEQVGNNKDNQQYAVVPLSLFQKLEQIHMDDKEMQKVEQLIKTINDSMLKETPETTMHEEQKQSLLALHHDVLYKQIEPDSRYFIGRFGIDRDQHSNIQFEIANAIDLYSGYYHQLYPLNTIGKRKKEAEKGAIQTYIAKKLGISPPLVEIEEIDELSVKVFFSGKSVSNYIAKCKPTNPSASETTKLTIGNNK